MFTKFLTTTCLFAIAAIIVGAYGAHGLKPFLSEEQVTSFETGVRYHFYHVFVLLSITIFSIKYYNTTLLISFLLFFTGIVFFSGSIYLLSTRHLHQLPVLWMGIFTPIGGLLFIIGWTTLLLYGFKV